MKISQHPLWLVGFRPFFVLAIFSGILFPVTWALIFNGHLLPTNLAVPPLQWHAHEMFFGFGFAVLGGFLLTATKNWVKIRGYHGPTLIFLVGAWLFERVGISFGGHWPQWVLFVSSYLFLASLLVMLMWTLLAHRQNDSYKDNIFFLLVLPLFLIAKNQILSPENFKVGVVMTLGLFRMAFLIMFERTLTQFMKNAFQVNILRSPLLDIGIKSLGVLLVFETYLPPSFSVFMYAALAILLAVRFIFWKPQLAFRRLDIGIMYLGYVALTAQLVLEALSRITTIVWIGTVSVHTFTFGVMGLVIPAMIVRISNGHTGRKVVFDSGIKLALWLMIAALILRIALPQLFSEQYAHFIWAAVFCWFTAFVVLGFKCVPMLLKPRTDGKEH